MIAWNFRTALLLTTAAVLALPAAALATGAIETSIPHSEEIDQAVALVTCKADRSAFRALAFRMRSVDSSAEHSTGWQPIATKGQPYGTTLGDMPGVIAELRLPAPVRVFGRPTTRLILSRSSVVAVFDDPGVAAELTASWSHEKRGEEGSPSGMRILRSTPEEHGDGVEIVALVADRIDADPSPISVAGCLYVTR
jgi:hypothetical protein